MFGGDGVYAILRIPGEGREIVSDTPSAQVNITNNKYVQQILNNISIKLRGKIKKSKIKNYICTANGFTLASSAKGFSL